MLRKIMTNSRTTEVHGLSIFVHRAYQQSGLLDNLVLAEILTSLERTNDKLGAAIDCSKVASQLSEKNEARNQALRAVGYLIKGYVFHPNQQVREAAMAVKKVFDKYGLAIIKQSYVSESSYIISMLGDFAQSGVQESVALLPGLLKNVEALKLAQNDFENTSAQYAGEAAGQAVQDSATELKKEVVKIINNDLVVFLRTSARFQPDVFGAFAGTVATFIESNNKQVKRRQKKKPLING